MNLRNQKRLAAQLLKCSESNVVFDSSRLDEIKESITKIDLRNLIKSHGIWKATEVGPSRVRARKFAEQKRKGRRKGQGSRKGRNTARLPRKEDWMNRIRKQRALLKELREKGVLSAEEYRKLYNNAKGGFFRSLRHLKMYINDKK
ncbi:MAG: 50S ribosomal protein L19e [Candidatus Woesearchaeota archaeon]